jgi:hypothetical protein
MIQGSELWQKKLVGRGQKVGGAKKYKFMSFFFVFCIIITEIYYWFSGRGHNWA